MFDPVSTTMVSAILSYSLERNPLSGPWLDGLEQQLEREMDYQPPTDFEAVFILGVPQSGATVIHQLLCQSPETAFFALGQLSVVDHFLLSDRWMEAIRWMVVSERQGLANDAVYDLESPEEGVHAFLSMCNHPLIQGRYGLVAAMDILSGREEVALGQHRELSSYIQQLNYRLREGQPNTFLNSYQVRKFREQVEKSVFVWRKRNRPVTHFLGKIPAASLSPRLFSYLFPGAKFVHIARSPQQVLPAFLKSTKETQSIPFISQRPINDRVLASYYGLLTQSLNQEVFDLDGANRAFHLTYEDLIRDPEPILKALVDFLGFKNRSTILDTGVNHVKALSRIPTTPTLQRIEELIATYAPNALEHYTRTQQQSTVGIQA
ncbi:sulfotransferase [Anthocerotibacter panamensis]|uniref:sulfotransferase n=1 Tax=Anthocerotibacter panamensis TaxID=2857077 RepID=UPI001C401CCE|nr:sulfotransferase [Anthocerotibacter panamensis]